MLSRRAATHRRRDRDGPKTPSSLIPHLLELRAATDLARLQGAQGQPLEARKVLTPVYGLFTDGADMADVQDAPRGAGGPGGVAALRLIAVAF
jgi:hypothetical protein